MFGFSAHINEYVARGNAGDVRHGRFIAVDVYAALRKVCDVRVRGLVTEEPVKTAKYYGVARDTLRRLSEEIKSDLKLE